MIERSPPTPVAMLLAWVFFCLLVCFCVWLGRFIFVGYFGGA